MDRFDRDVRRVVYGHIVREGRAPTVREAAAEISCGEDDAAASYRRLHDAHALVLFPDSLEIWMANPFCFRPTPHRVTAAGRTWTATCAWDALGIPAALHTDGLVETECACCREKLVLEVAGGRLTRGAELLVHFAVPARYWWADIGFT